MQKGSVIHFNSKPFTGIAFSRYSNGSVYMEEEYENGIRNGEKRIWYLNGQQKLKETYFNGKLKLVNGHMRTKHKIYFEKKFFDKKILLVNSYHNWSIPQKNVSKLFRVIAVDSYNNVEMFEHKKQRILGVMWHPERENNMKKFNKIISYLTIKNNRSI